MFAGDIFVATAVSRSRPVDRGRDRRVATRARPALPTRRVVAELVAAEDRVRGRDLDGRRRGRPWSRRPRARDPGVEEAGLRASLQLVDETTCRPPSDEKDEDPPHPARGRRAPRRRRSRSMLASPGTS